MSSGGSEVPKGTHTNYSRRFHLNAYSLRDIGVCILEFDRGVVQDATPSTIDVPHELQSYMYFFADLFLKYFLKFNQDFYDIYID